MNRSFRLHALVASCAFVVVGCASAPAAAEPRTQVRLDPQPAMEQPAMAAAASAPRPLPALPPLASDPTISDGNAPRLKSLTVENQDVQTVVRTLATSFGMQYHIDPQVHGVVNTTLRNKTLPEALSAILPAGTTYQIREGVLRVGPARVETRIFSLDYVALSRVGTASTVIQRRLGNGGASLGGGAASVGSAAGASAAGGLGGGASGTDIISAVSIADVWEDIRVAVEALVFDAPAAGAGQAASGSAGGTGRPYSRTAADGHRLIVNPIAGSITVSALPAQLDEIETFIRAFEASIQRQVLIEAKIVEVNLDRSFEFGIDWNALAKVGTSGLTVRSANTNGTTSGNVEFSLSGGPGQITAVLTALSTQGDVRVLSSPRVSALNNQRAVFDVTTGEIVFNLSRTPVLNANGTTTFISQVNPTQVNVGIVLDVLPQIGADNTVTMNIRPVVTSVRNTASFTSPDGTLFQAPVIDTRESDTMARLRAGETIIIGGLMQTRHEQVRGGVPGLRDIPLLGRLFTSYRDKETKAELVIFLTPTIIAGQPLAAR